VLVFFGLTRLSRKAQYPNIDRQGESVHGGEG